MGDGTERMVATMRHPEGRRTAFYVRDGHNGRTFSHYGIDGPPIDMLLSYILSALEVPALIGK
jgi:hypothetical protein